MSSNYEVLIHLFDENPYNRKLDVKTGEIAC